MKGYSKIKLMNSTKSRSMDFSDETIATPTIQKPISIKKSTITITQPPKKPDNNDEDNDDDDYNHYSGNNHHQEENNNFPPKMLTKNRSVASRNDGKNAISRSKIEKQNSTGSATLQTAVKRVLSIGRSSSVSERYSRIHDQYANYFEREEEEDGDDELKMGRSENKMKKKQRSHNRGGVFKACKRIFGF